jgi:aconitase A
MSGADLLNAIKQAREFGIVQSDQSPGEVSDVVDLADTPKSQVTVLIHRANGTSDRIRLRSRIDTAPERDWYQRAISCLNKFRQDQSYTLPNR